MKTGPQSKLNPRIQANMDSLLEVQLDSLNSQLQNSNAAWRQSAQSVFVTITNDMDRFADLMKQRLSQVSSETTGCLGEIESRVTTLKKRGLRLDSLLARHTLARMGLIAGLMALISLSGSFMATALMIKSQQPNPQALVQAPEALQGSRMIRGVGGLGELIALPPGLVQTRCPIGTGTGRICIQKEE